MGADAAVKATNRCLKYILEQFEQARKLYGDFIVRGHETGDKSIVFQVSERV